MDGLECEDSCGGGVGDRVEKGGRGFKMAAPFYCLLFLLFAPVSLLGFEARRLSRRGRNVTTGSAS
jgi:hypothetical protein